MAAYVPPEERVPHYSNSVRQWKITDTDVPFGKLLLWMVKFGLSWMLIGSILFCVALVAVAFLMAVSGYKVPEAPQRVENPFTQRR